MARIDTGVKIVTTTCAYDCGGRCPLQVHVKDGVIVRVEPMEGERVRKPCLKGRALRQMVYNPNRLKYPSRRADRWGNDTERSSMAMRSARHLGSVGNLDRIITGRHASGVARYESRLSVSLRRLERWGFP